MKTMTCKQLGGVCDMEFHAKTFEEMGEMGKEHGMEMAKKSDEPHMKVMEEMKKKMNDEKATEEWMEKKRQDFDALPDDK